MYFNGNSKRIFITALSVIILSSIFHFLGILDFLPWSVFYSDIVAFFDKATAPGFPYIDKLIEYPVLTGLFIQLAGYLGVTKTGYFIVSALFLLVLALSTTYLLLRINRFNSLVSSLPVNYKLPRPPSQVELARRCGRATTNFPLWAYWLLAPSMFFFSIFNWDFIPIFFVILAFYLFQKEKFNWSAASLAAGFSAKFFPIIYLPFLLWKIEGWGRRVKALASFVAGATILNIFFIIKNFDGWYYFFELNATRNSNFDSIWTLARFIFPSLAVSHINILSFALFAIAYILIFWKLKKEHFFKLCFAATLAFLLFSKVFSPQYILWPLPFFVLSFPPPWEGGGLRWGMGYSFYSLEFSNLASFFISLQWFFSVTHDPLYFYIDIPFIIIRYGVMAYILSSTMRKFVSSRD